MALNKLERHTLWVSVLLGVAISLEEIGDFGIYQTCKLCNQTLVFGREVLPISSDDGERDGAVRRFETRYPRARDH